MVPPGLERADTIQRDAHNRQIGKYKAGNFSKCQHETTTGMILRVVFGVFPSIDGVRGSRLLHPDALIIQTLVCISSLLLMYTAVVVPVLIGFYWETDDCYRSPLLTFDLFVDGFFMFEIIVTFFVGIKRRGHYVDDLSDVMWTYFKGAFWFDALTSFPVSVLEHISLEGCDPATGEGGGNAAQLRMVRLLKPFRLIKMMRVIKAMKILEVSHHVERALQLPPVFFRLMRVLFGICSVTHVVSCLFWLTKVTSNDPGEVDQWQMQYGLPLEDAPLYKKYILSIYVTIMVFTTVGFGDVTATNTTEQIFFVSVMLIGVLVFGTLLTEVQAGVGEMRRLQREKGLQLQSLLNFLRAENCDARLERRIMTWADFDIGVAQQLEQQRMALSYLLPPMKEKLVSVLHGGRLRKAVDYFDVVAAEYQDKLLDELWEHTTTVVYEENEVIASFKDPANALLLVVNGNVTVETERGESVGLLSAGDCIGEWSLLGDQDYSSLYAGVPVRIVAATCVHFAKLTKRSFDEVVARYPVDVRMALAQKQEDHRKQIQNKIDSDVSDGDDGDGLQSASMTEQRKLKHRRAVARWTSVVGKKMRLLKQQETTQGKKMMPGMGKKKNNSHKEPSASGGMWGMQMVHKFREAKAAGVLFTRELSGSVGSLASPVSGHIDRRGSDEGVPSMESAKAGAHTDQAASNSADGPPPSNAETDMQTSQLASFRGLPPGSEAARERETANPQRDSRGFENPERSAAGVSLPLPAAVPGVGKSSLFSGSAGIALEQVDLRSAIVFGGSSSLPENGTPNARAGATFSIQNEEPAHPETHDDQRASPTFGPMQPPPPLPCLASSCAMTLQKPPGRSPLIEVLEMRPGESEARPPRVIDSVRTPRAPPSSKESAEPRRNDSVPIEARARIGKAVVYPLQRAQMVSSHSSLGNSMPEAQTQAGGEQEGFASKREVSQLKEEVKGMRQDLNRVFAMVEAMHTAMLTSTKYQPHVPHEEPSSVAATPRLHEPPVAATSIQTGFSGPSPQGPIFGVGWPSP